MRTVKEFDDAGVVFVVGDKVCYKTGTYNGDESDLFECLVDTDRIQKPVMIGDKFACSIWTLSSFAWRKLTTKPDNAKFKIELDIANHRWRPSLNNGEEWPDEQRIDVIGQNGNDGTHYDNTAQQFEALASDKPVKPVFTQAMAQAGELPSLGSEVALRYKFDSKQIHIVGKVLYASMENCIIDGQHKECHYKMCDYTYESIPKTITVNGFEVPEPVRESLSYDDFYYVICLDADDFSLNESWDNNEKDFLWLSRGIIHLTKDAAIAHAKAMLGINPNADT